MKLSTRIGSYAVGTVCLAAGGWMVYGDTGSHWLVAGASRPRSGVWRRGA